MAWHLGLLAVKYWREQLACQHCEAWGLSNLESWIVLSQQQVLACVVDCIDCAADSAVVAAVLEGVTAAQQLAGHLHASEMCSTIRRPWIMVSINDDEDPHFRKAGELLRNLKSLKL
jgi:hypothetical protein